MDSSKVGSLHLEDKEFIQIVNGIFDSLYQANLSGREFQAIIFILRKTYGFKKKVDWITLSQFSENIGANRYTIHRVLDKLLKKKIITKETQGKGKGMKCYYGFQKYSNRWLLLSPRTTMIVAPQDYNKKVNVVPQDYKVLSPRTTIGSVNVVPQDNHKRKNTDSETFTKQTKEVERANVVLQDYNKKQTKSVKKMKEKKPLPDWIKTETWNAYLEMRKLIKHPMTPYAQELAIKKLDRFRGLGYDPMEIVNQSIEHSWQGLFPPTDDKSKPKKITEHPLAKKAFSEYRRGEKTKEEFDSILNQLSESILKDKGV